ncbi:HAD-IA family hydrolase [Litorisediminicola beolgyonensis]|uniref:phosphoglycolate phosphatase n=1 Tax=Litorisediminicola beolgyonensis TaxID=1173614 RepID=A0ABW3ZM89_9RHOB
MRTVIFDLDGTLADTSADLIAAANHCFRGMGAGAMLDPVADAATAFRGGRAMLRLGLGRIGAVDDAVIDRWYPELLRAYGDAICVETRLYPGAVEAVEALRAKGMAVGICTNKPEGLAVTLVERLGVAGLFASLVGADTLPVRKPDPTPFFEAVDRAGGARSRSLLVGDTETDRETARAAGVPSVLVGFGPEGPGVARMDPDAVIASYAELPAVAARLLD